MPFLRFTPIRFVLFLFLFSLAFFSACSGGSSGKGLPGNGDGTLGAKPRSFFRTDSVSQVSILRIDDGGSAKRFLFTSPSTLVEVGTLSADQYNVSVDQKFATVLGQTQVFEYQNIAPETLGQSGTVIPPPSIEALCLASPFGANMKLGNTLYQELHITVDSKGYQFVAVSTGAQTTLLGNPDYALRTDSEQQVEYANSTYGSLKLDLSSSLSHDANYYHATLTTNTGSEWSNVQNMYCHSNRSPIAAQDPLLTPHGTNPKAFPDGSVSTGWFDMSKNVALWHLDGTGLDSSGKGHTGTLNNLTFPTGFIGIASLFDGMSSQFTLADTSDLQFGTHPFAMSLWFYFDDTARVSTLLSKRQTAWPFSQINIMVGNGNCNVPASGKLLTVLLMSDNILGHCMTGGTLAPGWHHIVLSATESSTGTGTGILYLDGVSKDSTSMNNETYNMVSFPFSLGYLPTVGNYFNNQIDEVAIWKGQSLSATDAATIYNHQK